jgi:hypothetical protein
MAKGITLGNYFVKPKKKRKGVHAKTKQSKNKNSKTYTKPYRGQGRT